MSDGDPHFRRIAARNALIASLRTANGSHAVAAASISAQLAAAAAVMVGVSLNSISAQNITDINAALATAVTSQATAVSAMATVMTAMQTSMADTGESA